jgi:hypothetical protein
MKISLRFDSSWLEIGRGGGDRKDKLLNKAWALCALQLPLLSNWNKRNRNREDGELCSFHVE